MRLTLENKQKKIKLLLSGFVLAILAVLLIVIINTDRKGNPPKIDRESLPSLPEQTVARNDAQIPPAPPDTSPISQADESPQIALSETRSDLNQDGSSSLAASEIDQSVKTPASSRKDTGLAIVRLLDTRNGRSVDVQAGKVLVKFKKSVTDIEVEQLLAKRGSQITERKTNVLAKIGYQCITVPEGISLSDFIASLRQEPSIESVEANVILRSNAEKSPVDSAFTPMWNLEAICVPEAWQITQGDPNVVVAVVDSGIAGNHPDLSQNLVAGYNFCADNSDTEDDHGHGTQVAGIIGAQANPQTGTSGIAPGTRMMPLKVLDANGEGTAGDVAEGIVYAADYGARVISLALGTYAESGVLEAAIEYAASRNCLIIAAAGNNGSDEPTYPAAFPKTLAVGAVNKFRKPCFFTNRAAYVDIVAPGQDVLTTAYNGEHQELTGTSAAAAHLAGVAALMLATSPSLDIESFQAILQNTASDLEVGGWDAQTGFGLVDCAAAVKCKQAVSQEHIGIVNVVSLPERPLANQSVNIFLAVRNHCIRPLQGASASISRDGQVVAMVDIPSVAPKQTKEICLQWMPSLSDVGKEVNLVVEISSETGKISSSCNSIRQIEIPVTDMEYYDVAVLSVRPVCGAGVMVREGIDLNITVEVANKGNMTVADAPVLLHLHKEAELGNLTVSLEPGEKKKLVFPWQLPGQPSFGKLSPVHVLNATILCGEEAEKLTIDNTYCTKIVHRANDDMIRISHSNDGTHQWIAYQAYKYFNSHIEGANLGFFTTYKDQTWNSSPAGSNLLDGAWAEDVSYRSPGATTPKYPMHDHFVIGHSGLYTGISVPWYGLGQSALTRAEYILENLAKPAWDTDKAEAIYWLGHLAHLVADMCVPAHALGDPHWVPYIGKDGYEELMAVEENFRKYTYENIGGYWRRVPILFEDIYSIFYATVNYTDDYDSDDRDGDSSYYEPSDYSCTKHRPSEVSRNALIGGISDPEKWIIADDLMPYAIARCADLYRTFYSLIDTSPPTVDLDYPDSSDINNPTQVYSFSAFDVTASASDKESGILKENYKFQWSYWTGSSWSDWKSVSRTLISTGNSVYFTPRRPATFYRFRVSAENGGGKRAESKIKYLRIIPPSLSNMSVTPSSGTTQDTFTYRVTYYDQSGMAPQEAKVYINGTAYDMALESGSYANGTYQYPTRLPEGTHNYLFYFESGNGNIIESELFSGPVVGKFDYPKDLVITRPTANPYYTSDSRVTVEVLPPNGTTKVECYRNNVFYENLSKGDDGLWNCRITLKKNINNNNRNDITLKAYNGDSLLDEASITIFRRDNIRTIALGEGDYVWGGVWEAKPKKHYGDDGGNIWDVGYDKDGWWNELFLRFNDISDKLVGAETQPDHDTPITSAELMLTVVGGKSSLGTGTYNIIVGAIKDWQLDVEYVRWNNRPTHIYPDTEKIVPSYVDVDKEERPTLRIDATTAVKGWVYWNRPNKGFWLRGDYNYYGFLRCLRTDDCALLISYTHETTPPDIIINTPPANERQVPNATTSITVSGTASDKTSVSNVTWKNESSGTSGNCNGNTNWSCSIDLIVGENRIVITATDAVENKESRTIFVYRSEPEILPTPYALPVSGSYLSPLAVTVTCPEDGATIRYTKDGTEPTENSAIWSDRMVDLPAKLKFRAFKPNWRPSEPFTAEYTRSYNATVNSGLWTGIYEENQIFPLVADPIPFGYESFEAWTVEPRQYAERIADANSANTTFTMPAANVILTATYRPKVYTVIFKPGDIGQRIGGGELVQQVAHDKPAIAPEIATENGLDLIGWDVDFSRIIGPLTARAIYAHRYNLNAGWNLISNNLILNNQSQQYLRSRKAMTLPQAGDAYVFSKNLPPTQACWIYCRIAETFTLLGTSPENFDFAASLKPGWNLVGPIIDSLLSGDNTIAWGWDGQHLYPTKNVCSGSGYYLYWPEQHGEVAPFNGEYLIIDLSGGPSVSRYPIDIPSTPPVGGWSDEYKTTKLVLRRIPAGIFMMGSPENELGRWGGETQHQVTLTKDFYVGVFEVTQKQWELVMGDWPSYFSNASCRDARPVEMISYDDIRGSGIGSGWPDNNAVDADSFLGRLRARTDMDFDLPTEAQWEYACRAGSTAALNSGKDLTSTTNCPNMAEVGRCYHNGGSGFVWDGDTSCGSAKVGSYLPNQWGLYDMHGNLWEWCLDWWDCCDYPPYMVTDPEGDASGVTRIARGGSGYNDAGCCRSASRSGHLTSHQTGHLGFRLVRAVP
ncbi:MAG: Thermophilic serine proteinase precursor [Lentisphaerae bacterium ADurb.Bin082]|nr:MAG: Thermophilic serine proteinase precursor [Lentisphaerae bacterium ADurb.Bin082]